VPPTAEQQLGARKPRTRLIALIVAFAVIGAGAVIAYQLTRPTTGCVLSSADPLIFDQPEAPDTLDPSVTFSTPGWGSVQQVYQTLVMYNGSSYQTFLPVLAKTLPTVSADRFNYAFRLRQGIHFSNGDPLNAYTMWYSLYRTIIMNQAPEFILGQNFFLPGLNNLTATPSQVSAMKAFMTNTLNTGDFVNPTGTQLTFMKRPDQSFQIIDNLTLQVNLGWGYLGHVPYSYVLATLSSPVSAAVDPAVVKANGGVKAGEANGWMVTHMIGSGPYVLITYNKASGMTLRRDSSYWGTTAATAEPWNNALQAARTAIQINYQGTTQTTVQDLKSGTVAGASFAYVGPSTVNDLKGAACVTVNPLDSVYSSTAGGWWIYMNQNTPPFNNKSVRAAVVHAINYDEIIRVAFGGYAKQWVGPVPPGYPNYNPDTLAPYPYDLARAKREMNNSPWPLPGGYPQTLNYEYIKLGDWATVATLLQADLAKIGIRINPVGIPLPNLYAIQLADSNGVCASQAVPNQFGGPFPIGQEFYTSDYISPDDWTQNNALSSGSANACMSAYADAQVDRLVIDAAGVPSNATADYRTMTRKMYDNYTNAWLVVPQQFSIYNLRLKGFVPNPMGSALPFTMMFNTEYAG
jgi:peptide/nickel transport system substrate-binding protein